MSPDQDAVDRVITQEYVESDEGQARLQKLAKAFDNMRKAADNVQLQKLLTVAEREEVGYPANRAGRRAQAKAQKTRGSQQRRVDRKAAAKWNRGK